MSRDTAGWMVAAALFAGCGGGGSGDDTTDATTVAATGGDITGSQPTSGPGGTTTTGEVGSSSDASASAIPTGEGSFTSEAADSSSGESGEPPPVTCTDGTCHHVRAGAAGSGADWDDALPELPAALERGHVYFVAAGSYAGHSFADAESGELQIRVLRASSDDHGSDVGWDPAYAAGEATFGPLGFSSGRYTVDGRGASRAVADFMGTAVVIDGSVIDFRGFDVDAAFQETDGKQTGGGCTGMSIGGDDVLVANNNIHDAADDGVVMGGMQNLLFTGNVVHALHGCGTDNGCGPCYNGHSDGLELYDVVDTEIVGNLIYDVASTSAVFFGNYADELGMGPSEYCENILLANNLLYSPQTGFVAYLEDVRGVQLFNNVLWGLHMGAYGGLSIGTHVQDLDMFNNVILSINYTHIGGMYDPVEHRGDYNLFAYALGQWTNGPHDVVAVDPLFVGISGGEGPAVAAPSPADFAPQVGSPMIGAGYGGDADIVIPAIDFFGVPRGDPPNLGAIE